MIYIEYTLVDHVTRVPINEEDSLHGPCYPSEDITFLFAKESKYPTNNPEMFGSVEDSRSMGESGIVRQISKETFLSLFKQELKQRATLRRKAYVNSGVVLKDSSRFDSSKSAQDGLASVISTMSLDKTIKSVDFESYSWIKLTLSEAKDILKSINKQTQQAFSWCCKMHQEVDKCKTIEECLLVSHIIAEGVK